MAVPFSFEMIIVIVYLYVSVLIIFNILHSTVKLIVLIVAEYLHRGIIVKRDTHFNGVTADTLGRGVCVRLAFFVENKSNVLIYSYKPVREQVDHRPQKRRSLGNACNTLPRDCGQVKST